MLEALHGGSMSLPRTLGLTIGDRRLFCTTFMASRSETHLFRSPKCLVHRGNLDHLIPSTPRRLRRRVSASFNLRDGLGQLQGRSGFFFSRIFCAHLIFGLYGEKCELSLSDSLASLGTIT